MQNVNVSFYFLTDFYGRINQNGKSNREIKWHGSETLYILLENKVRQLFVHQVINFKYNRRKLKYSMINLLTVREQLFIVDFSHTWSSSVMSKTPLFDQNLCAFLSLHFQYRCLNVKVFSGYVSQCSGIFTINLRHFRYFSVFAPCSPCCPQPPPPSRSWLSAPPQCWLPPA